MVSPGKRTSMSVDALTKIHRWQRRSKDTRSTMAQIARDVKLPVSTVASAVRALGRRLTKETSKQIVADRVAVFTRKKPHKRTQRAADLASGQPINLRTTVRWQASVCGLPPITHRRLSWTRLVSRMHATKSVDDYTVSPTSARSGPQISHPVSR